MDSNCAGISGIVSDLFLVSEYYLLSVHVLEVHVHVHVCQTVVYTVVTHKLHKYFPLENFPLMHTVELIKFW